MDKKQMNILIFSWRGPKHPHSGGAEIATLEHAKYWSSTGHKVTWFTSAFAKSKTEEKIQNIKIIRKGNQVVTVQIYAFFWYMFAKHEDFDVVIDQFHGLPFFTPLFVKAKKLAYIHEIAGDVWKYNPWPKPFNLVPAIFGQLTEKYIFKMFYKNVKFMTVSDSTKNDLVNFGIRRKNIHVIYNGINLDQAPKQKPKKEVTQTIVFLGALSFDKGIKDAIEIFKLVSNIRGKTRLWIIGRGSPDMKAYLFGQVKKLKLSRNFKYWGYVSEKEKFQLLAKSHLLINPSYREGWGLVNIEANAMGTPVVAYNVVGCRDSIVHGVTGVLVEKHNYAKFAKEVDKLLSNTKKYNQIRKNAIYHSKIYEWRKSTKQSLELISNL